MQVHAGVRPRRVPGGSRKIAIALIDPYEGVLSRILQLFPRINSLENRRSYSLSLLIPNLRDKSVACGVNSGETNPSISRGELVTKPDSELEGF